MREAQPRTLYLKDYQPPAFLIDRVMLDVDIRAEDTIVRATLSVRRNPAAADRKAPLELDGDELEFVSIALDGALLRANQYAVTAERLTVADAPVRFTLETVCRIAPQKYSRRGGLCAPRSGFARSARARGGGAGRGFHQSLALRTPRRSSLARRWLTTAKESAEEHSTTSTAIA